VTPIVTPSIDDQFTWWYDELMAKDAADHPNAPISHYDIAALAWHEAWKRAESYKGDIKWCRKCSSWKKLADFYTYDKGKGTTCSYCKSCMGDAHRKWVKNNPGKHATHKKNYALTRSYVRAMIVSTAHKKGDTLSPSQELIELRRVRLIMRRTMREFKGWLKDHQPEGCSAMPHPPGTKWCKHCSSWKDPPLFVKKKGSRSGYGNRCKDCFNKKYNTKTRKEHIDESNNTDVHGE
jgi:hypothetical protein